MARPIPLPASPHVLEKFVSVMYTEEGEEIVDKQQWPPIKRYTGAPRPHDFLSKCSAGGGKKIAWPPHLDTEGINEEYLLQQDPNYQKPERKEPVKEELGKQNEPHPNLVTFKLRESAPMSQPAAQTVPSQPAFKITQPVKMRGDNKWPPAKPGEEVTQNEVREFIKPKKGNRDYSEFFAQNALPNNYPGYRAPPGTQHHGGEESELVETEE